MSFFSKIGGLLFGGKSDKSIVEQAADAIERFAPGEVKRHEMSIEDIKAGDESQRSAQAMVLASHNSWFDILVDGLNRLVRPAFSFWALFVLAGIVSTDHLIDIPPMAWNIVWTVAGFWFGTRMVMKDIPEAIVAIKALKTK